MSETFNKAVKESGFAYLIPSHAEDSRGKVSARMDAALLISLFKKVREEASLWKVGYI